MYQKSSLSEKVLDYLKETSMSLLDASVTIIFEPRKLHQISLYRDASIRQYYPKNFANLKRSPYFSFHNDEFHLTPRGRVHIIRKIIKEKKDVKRWDKKWRAVIFDIPESRRRQRNFLRRELKWMGFVELQHSIWISPYHIEKELACLLELWQKDFKGDIKLLKIEEMSGDEYFRRIFFSNNRRSSKS